MLSAVERCVDEVARVRGERIDLSRIPYDDDSVYETIQKAETTGVFQIESRAQMQMLKRTLPRSLDDLTVQVALVRPGPIIGGAVHPYIERRKRLRVDPSYRVPYEHPSLEPVLRDTLGAIVFQDQVLEVAMALAGFSPGEAEGLRRAMSRKRSEAAMALYRERFIEGAVGRGVARVVAERVYDQVQGFSGFGFPKAHAAAFGLLAYQSTWLRVHYEPEFLCALLNEQPMGFYPPDALVHEAQRRGMVVLPPHVNRSEVECRVEVLESARRAGPSGVRPFRPETGVSRSRRPHPLSRASSADDDTPERSRAKDASASLAVRLGLGYVRGVKEEEVRRLVRAREEGGVYRDSGDLVSRSGAGRDTLERLAWAGACDGLGHANLLSENGAGAHGDAEAGKRAWRRDSLWQVGVPSPGREVPGGVQLALPLDAPEPPALRPLTAWERLLADYGSFRVSVDEHPLELMRAQLGEGVASSRDLEQMRHGATVETAGLVVARQRPATANGVTFMLLEDEWGTINLIVAPPVYERFRLIVRAEPFVFAVGRLEHRDGTTNVIVREMRALQRPDLPLATVKHIEPPAGREVGRDAGRDRKGRERERAAAAAAGGAAAADAGDLRSVLPVPHSFGRRGR
jgi:error-prone DNA polymerase